MTTQPKPLTDADLVVGNRFECLQDIFRGQYGMSFSKGCKYTCEARGTLMSNEGLNHVLSAAVLNHHFKLIQTVQNENVIEFQNKVIDISTKEVSDLTNQLLLLQQENALLKSQLQAQGELLKSVVEGYIKLLPAKDLAELIDLMKGVKG